MLLPRSKRCVLGCRQECINRAERNDCRELKVFAAFPLVEEIASVRSRTAQLGACALSGDGMCRIPLAVRRGAVASFLEREPFAGLIGCSTTLLHFLISPPVSGIRTTIAYDGECTMIGSTSVASPMPDRRDRLKLLSWRSRLFSQPNRRSNASWPRARAEKANGRLKNPGRSDGG